MIVYWKIVISWIINVGQIRIIRLFTFDIAIPRSIKNQYESFQPDPGTFIYCADIEHDQYIYMALITKKIEWTDDSMHSYQTQAIRSDPTYLE